MEYLISRGVKYAVRLLLLFVFVCTGFVIYETLQQVRILNLPSCPSNLNQIGLAAFMYDQDYGELPPVIFHNKTIGWANGLEPYTRSYSVFQCKYQWHSFSGNPKPDQPGFTDYWMNSNLSATRVS